ncbi:putative ste24 endopeptidase [Helianthus debilis subsp. tardiflorus]
MYIFETYLHLRQHAALKLRTLPKTLVGVISQETFEKYRAYNIDKRLWKKSGDIVESTGLDAENEIYQTLAFLACVMYWSRITDLPFSLYSTFVIEERHGFNEKGGPYLAIYLWGFIFVLSLFMMTIFPVLLPPLCNMLTPLLQGELRTKIETLASSQNFPSKKLFVVDGSTWSTHSNAYLFGFSKNKCIALFDTLIQQCTNEEETVAVVAHELGHWKLNHKIYSFVGVQVGRVQMGFVSSHWKLDLMVNILILLLFGGYTLVKNSNDLFMSFGFDTQPVIIEFILFQKTQARKMEVAEMRMLRWMCGHTRLDRIRNEVFRERLGVASISKKIKEGRLRWFGHVKRRETTAPVRVVETLTVEGRRGRGRPKLTWDEQYTIIPVQHLVSFDLNLVTHAFEFQADAFAKKLGYAKPLRDALVKMQVGNLSEMNTDPWYSAYHYSHPTLLERLAALDEPHNKAD